MVTRAETAAATRHALLAAASELLRDGGPDGVTLRAVGARAGVSRGAPYGHFANKEQLLAQLAIDAWHRLADDLAALRADADLTPQARLERALIAFVNVARDDPHLYALMFTPPPSGDDASLISAAGKSQDDFIEIVADIVGHEDARRVGALLLSSAYGIAGMELAGHLAQKKWDVSGNELIAMLVRAIGLR
jgi:AcrR family transcriptional regulator